MVEEKLRAKDRKGVLPVIALKKGRRGPERQVLHYSRVTLQAAGNQLPYAPQPSYDQMPSRPENLVQRGLTMPVMEGRAMSADEMDKYDFTASYIIGLEKTNAELRAKLNEEPKTASMILRRSRHGTPHSPDTAPDRDRVSPRFKDMACGPDRASPRFPEGASEGASPRFPDVASRQDRASPRFRDVASRQDRTFSRSPDTAPGRDRASVAHSAEDPDRIKMDDIDPDQLEKDLDRGKRASHPRNTPRTPRAPAEKAAEEFKLPSPVIDLSMDFGNRNDFQQRHPTNKADRFYGDKQKELKDLIGKERYKKVTNGREMEQLPNVLQYERINNQDLHSISNGGQRRTGGIAVTGQTLPPIDQSARHAARGTRPLDVSSRPHPPVGPSVLPMLPGLTGVHIPGPAGRRPTGHALNMMTNGQHDAAWTPPGMQRSPPGQAASERFHQGYTQMRYPHGSRAPASRLSPIQGTSLSRLYSETDDIDRVEKATRHGIRKLEKTDPKKLRHQKK